MIHYSMTKVGRGMTQLEVRHQSEGTASRKGSLLTAVPLPLNM